MRYFVLILAAFLLLSSCGMPTRPNEYGRYPVELIVVDRVSKNFVARVTSRSTIIIEREYKRNVTIVAHELCHIVQWNTLGATFPTLYAKQWISYGYDNMPLELECDRLEQDEWYRDWARDLIDTL